MPRSEVDRRTNAAGMDLGAITPVVITLFDNFAGQSSSSTATGVLSLDADYVLSDAFIPEVAALAVSPNVAVKPGLAYIGQRAIAESSLMLELLSPKR